MRPRGQDHQGVDVGRRQEPIERRETGRGGDPITLADDLDEAGRQVGDRRDLEAVGESIEERQVDGLGHRTEAEDADSDAIRHGERCGWRCHRAKYRWGARPPLPQPIRRQRGRGGACRLAGHGARVVAPAVDEGTVRAMPKAPSRATKPAASPEPDAEAPKAPKPPGLRAAPPSPQSKPRSPRRHGRRLRRRLVAAWRRLPGLPTLVRGRNDDGVGDLPGLIDKLDYVNDGTERSLGVDAIWLSPIHPRPASTSVTTSPTTTRSIRCSGPSTTSIGWSRRRTGAGIRIMLDLVMNHTSSAHRWFEESRRDPAGPFGDWYLWREACGTDSDASSQPNNWTSFFGGSAWTWDEVRGQFYMHTFLPEQPDVNWRNPAVREAMLTMVRGWLERGVDGFRLDVFNAFFKDARAALEPAPLSRTPPVRPAGPSLRQGPAGAGRLPDRVPGARRFFPERMTVGELFSGDPALAPKLSAPRHLVFDFELIGSTGRPRGSPTPARSTRSDFGATRWPTIVLSNHDQSRQASRLAPGADAETSDEVARAAAVLSLTMRGTPFLYYGEEIGARDVPVPW